MRDFLKNKISAQKQRISWSLFGNMMPGNRGGSRERETKKVEKSIQGRVIKWPPQLVSGNQVTGAQAL